MMSRWPIWRAVSSIMWMSTRRRETGEPSRTGRAVGVSGGAVPEGRDVRAAEQEVLEPAELDPAQVVDQAGHAHRGGGGQHAPVRLLLGEALAFHRGGGPVPVEKSEEKTRFITGGRRCLSSHAPNLIRLQSR